MSGVKCLTGANSVKRNTPVLEFGLSQARTIQARLLQTGTVSLGPPYLKTAVQDQDPNPVLCSAMEQSSVVILLDDRLQHAKDTFNRGAVTWLMSSVSKPKEAA